MTMDKRPTVGWREWVSLPELGIPGVKVKIDTGARTSALHAFMLEPFESNDGLWIKFGVNPLRKRKDIEVFTQARVIDERWVTDSGGHSEMRYVIETTVLLGNISFPADITLTDRDGMIFPMLLGRKAVQGRFLIDPAQKYVLSRRQTRIYTPGSERKSE
jgi:hypothetical protein